MNEPTNRCKTICGEKTAGCFMTDENQLQCITNIIITRVWAAREIIDMGARETNCNHMSELLSMAMDEMDELIYWMQQIRNIKRGAQPFPQGARSDELLISSPAAKGDCHAVR